MRQSRISQLTKRYLHDTVLFVFTDTKRAVAQGFSVRVWGTRGRWFKSTQPDTQKGIGFSLFLFLFRARSFVQF